MSLPSCFSPGSIAGQLQCCDRNGLSFSCASVALLSVSGHLLSASHLKYLALLFECLPPMAACVFNAGQGFFVGVFFFLLCKAFLPVFCSVSPFLSLLSGFSLSVGLFFTLVPIVFGSEYEYYIYIFLSLLCYNTEVIQVKHCSTSHCSDKLCF